MCRLWRMAPTCCAEAAALLAWHLCACSSVGCSGVVHKAEAEAAALLAWHLCACSSVGCSGVAHKAGPSGMLELTPLHL
jgi:hypothetical protein